MAKQIIPVIGVFYDETDFVDDWIRCVLSQNTNELDVAPIIVANYHKTESARIRDSVLRLRDDTGQTINLVPLNTNDGHSHAFNRGLDFVNQEISHAKWITSLDPDARLGKNSIQSMLDRTREVKSCGMVTPIVLRCEKEQNALAKCWTVQTDPDSIVLHA
ncbi:MAG TPA: hypothetical protein DDZ51_29880 [Planctomycetaceae bacterium]|nr:hypothetical protein [Planctomycetaceae bacterium]